MKTPTARVRSAAAGLAFGLCVLAALAVLTALGGCTTVAIGRLEPALFPAATAASAPAAAARVALLLPPTVRELTHTGPPGLTQAGDRIQLPLGAVVEAALLRQLGAAFEGGVQLVAAPTVAGVDLVVTVGAARLDFDRHLNWLVPLPLPVFLPVAASTDHIAVLALDLRITDAQGHFLAQSTVDSGRVTLERGLWKKEEPIELYQKLLHQAAWQAAAKVAEAARDALRADRLRERAL